MSKLIYARFSSQLQNSRSMEDQVRVSMERVAGEGWPAINVFSDTAIGAAVDASEHKRPGMNTLLARVEAGGVDQVLATRPAAWRATGVMRTTSTNA